MPVLYLIGTDYLGFPFRCSALKRKPQAGTAWGKGRFFQLRKEGEVN